MPFIKYNDDNSEFSTNCKKQNVFVKDNRFLIKKIVLSPIISNPYGETSVKLLLNKYNFLIDIKKSEIPWRG